MARVKVSLNSAGIAAVLKSPAMQALVRSAVEAVAGNVRGQGHRVGDRDGGPREVPLPVETSVSLTDRAHGRVTLAHAAGQAVQAKHGALTKAAAGAGLSVRGY